MDFKRKYKNDKLETNQELWWKVAGTQCDETLLVYGFTAQLLGML